MNPKTSREIVQFDIYNWQVMTVIATIVFVLVGTAVSAVVARGNDATLSTAKISALLGAMVGGFIYLNTGENSEFTMLYRVFGDKARVLAMLVFPSNLIAVSITAVAALISLDHPLTNPLLGRLALIITATSCGLLFVSAIFQLFVALGKQLPKSIFWKEPLFRDLLAQQKLMATDGKALSKEALEFINQPDVSGYKIYHETDDGALNTSFFHNATKWLCVYGDHGSIWDPVRNQQEIWSGDQRAIPAGALEVILEIPDLSAREKLQLSSVHTA